jgi:hypothetical protein
MPIRAMLPTIAAVSSGVSAARCSGVSGIQLPRSTNSTTNHVLGSRLFGLFLFSIGMRWPLSAVSLFV